MRCLAVCGLLLAVPGCGSSPSANGGDGGVVPDASNGADVVDGGPEAADADASTASAVFTMGDFIGVNAFIDDPTAKLVPIGNVREYHNWSWIEGNGATNYPGYPNNQDSFVLFSGTWNWDTYFASMQQAGLFA
jgi:hypothetical protein